ncbi:MAG: helix-turn-helix domain-containing protein [Treponema sp.]|jgi:transcriptional regulator with XRE-family HTH domain|nr:helix-turn-helix domain-containing protein [Treponema sp.]
MEGIRETLAKNLKEKRRKFGITQPTLAERANLSTHYLAMIEIARKFPTADVLDRLAAALDVAPYELFSVPPSPEEAMDKLQQAILDNLNRAIENAVDKAVQKALYGKCKD